MADPGAEAIVIGGIDHRNFGAHLFGAMDEFSTLPGVNVLARKWCEEPGSAYEEIRVGKLNAGIFLAGHRMPSQEFLPGVASKRFCGARNDLRLGAAHVGDKRLGWQRRTKPPDQVENRDHGCRKDD